MNFLKKLFGIKKKVEPYVPREGSVSLTIYLRDNRALGWSRGIATPLDSEEDYFKCYEDFTKWYENPPDAFYVMRFKGGEQMFRHEDIKRYEISYVVPEVVQYSGNVIPLKNG